MVETVLGTDLGERPSKDPVSAPSAAATSQSGSVHGVDSATTRVADATAALVSPPSTAAPPGDASVGHSCASSTTGDGTAPIAPLETDLTRIGPLSTASGAANPHGISAESLNNSRVSIRSDPVASSYDLLSLTSLQRKRAPNESRAAGIVAGGRPHSVHLGARLPPPHFAHQPGVVASGHGPAAAAAAAASVQPVFRTVRLNTAEATLILRGSTSTVQIPDGPHTPTGPAALTRQSSVPTSFLPTSPASCLHPALASPPSELPTSRGSSNTAITRTKSFAGSSTVLAILPAPQSAVPSLVSSQELFAGTHPAPALRRPGGAGAGEAASNARALGEVLHEEPENEIPPSDAAPSPGIISPSISAPPPQDAPQAGPEAAQGLPPPQESTPAPAVAIPEPLTANSVLQAAPSSSQTALAPPPLLAGLDGNATHAAAAPFAMPMITPVLGPAQVAPVSPSGSQSGAEASMIEAVTLADANGSPSAPASAGAVTVEGNTPALEVFQVGTIFYACQDFRASDESEISLDAGLQVTLLSERATYDDYWWYGSRHDTGQEGFFPSFAIARPLTHFDGSTPASRGPTEPASVERLTPVGTPGGHANTLSPAPPGMIAHEQRPEATNSLAFDDADVMALAYAGGAAASPAALDTLGPGAQVRVRYQWQPTKSDELQLIVGDLIVILQAPPGGWVRGIKDMHSKQPKSGWFPAAMVLPVTTSAAVPATAAAGHAASTAPATAATSASASAAASATATAASTRAPSPTTSLDDAGSTRSDKSDKSSRSASSWFKRLSSKQIRNEPRGSKKTNLHTRSISAPIGFVPPSVPATLEERSCEALTETPNDSQSLASHNHLSDFMANASHATMPAPGIEPHAQASLASMPLMSHHVSQASLAPSMSTHRLHASALPMESSPLPAYAGMPASPAVASQVAASSSTLPSASLPPTTTLSAVEALVAPVPIRPTPPLAAPIMRAESLDYGVASLPSPPTPLAATAAVAVAVAVGAGGDTMGLEAGIETATGRSHARLPSDPDAAAAAVVAMASSTSSMPSSNARASSDAREATHAFALPEPVPEAAHAHASPSEAHAYSVVVESCVIRDAPAVVMATTPEIHAELLSPMSEAAMLPEVAFHEAAAAGAATATVPLVVAVAPLAAEPYTPATPTTEKPDMCEHAISAIEETAEPPDADADADAEADADADATLVKAAHWSLVLPAPAADPPAAAAVGSSPMAPPSVVVLSALTPGHAPLVEPGLAAASVLPTMAPTILAVLDPPSSSASPTPTSWTRPPSQAPSMAESAMDPRASLATTTCVPDGSLPSRPDTSGTSQDADAASQVSSSSDRASSDSSLTPPTAPTGRRRSTSAPAPVPKVGHTALPNARLSLPAPLGTVFSVPDLAGSEDAFGNGSPSRHVGSSMSDSMASKETGPSSVLPSNATSTISTMPIGLFAPHPSESYSDPSPLAQSLQDAEQNSASPAGSYAASPTVGSLLEDRSSIYTFSHDVDTPKHHTMLAPETSPASQAATVDDRDSRRVKPILELITTERAYVRDLKVLVSSILQPLLERKILTQKQAHQLFSNVDQLLVLNTEFLNRLAEWQVRCPQLDCAGFAELIAGMSEKLAIYADYTGNHASALTKLASLQHNKAFRGFLDELYRSGATQNMNLESYLLKPIQRVCKYPLLVKEVLKCCQTGSSDEVTLKEAYLQLQGQMAALNEQTSHPVATSAPTPLVRKMSDVQAAFADRSVHILSPERQLQREEPVFLVTAGVKVPRKILLFNDMVILARKDAREKYHVVDKFDLRDVTFTNVANQKAVTDILELDHLRSGQVHILACSRAIKASILEFVKRNPHCPAIKHKTMNETALAGYTVLVVATGDEDGSELTAATASGHGINHLGGNGADSNRPNTADSTTSSVGSGMKSRPMSLAMPGTYRTLASALSSSASNGTASPRRRDTLIATFTSKRAQNKSQIDVKRTAEELGHVLAEAESELDRLRREIKEAGEKAFEADAQIRELNNALAMAHLTSSDLQKLHALEMQDMEVKTQNALHQALESAKQAADVDKKLQTLSMEAGDTYAELTTLRMEYAELHTALMAERDDHAALKLQQMHLAGIQATAAALQNELSQLHEQHQQTLHTLETFRQTHASVVAEWTASHAQLQQQLAAAQTQLAQSEAAGAEREEAFDTARRAWQQQLDGVESRLAASQRDVDDAQSREAALVTQIRVAEEERTDMLKKQRRLTLAEELLRTRTDMLTTRVEDLTQRLAAADDGRRGAEATVGQLQSDLSAAQAAQDALQGEADAHRAQLAQLDRQLATCHTELADAQAQLEALNAQHAALTQRHGEAQETTRLEMDRMRQLQQEMEETATAARQTWAAERQQLESSVEAAVRAEQTAEAGFQAALYKKDKTHGRAVRVLKQEMAAVQQTLDATLADRDSAIHQLRDEGAALRQVCQDQKLELMALAQRHDVLASQLAGVHATEADASKRLVAAEAETQALRVQMKRTKRRTLAQKEKLVALRSENTALDQRRRQARQKHHASVQQLKESFEYERIQLYGVQQQLQQQLLRACDQIEVLTRAAESGHGVGVAGHHGFSPTATAAAGVHAVVAAAPASIAPTTAVPAAAVPAAASPLAPSAVAAAAASAVAAANATADMAAAASLAAETQARLETAIVDQAKRFRAREQRARQFTRDLELVLTAMGQCRTAEQVKELRTAPWLLALSTVQRYAARSRRSAVVTLLDTVVALFQTHELTEDLKRQQLEARLREAQQQAQRADAVLVQYERGVQEKAATHHREYQRVRKEAGVLAARVEALTRDLTAKDADAAVAKPLNGLLHLNEQQSEQLRHLGEENTRLVNLLLTQSRHEAQQAGEAAAARVAAHDAALSDATAAALAAATSAAAAATAAAAASQSQRQSFGSTGSPASAPRSLLLNKASVSPLPSPVSAAGAARGRPTVLPLMAAPRARSPAPRGPLSATAPSSREQLSAAPASAPAVVRRVRTMSADLLAAFQTAAAAAHADEADETDATDDLDVVGGAERDPAADADADTTSMPAAPGEWMPRGVAFARHGPSPGVVSPPPRPVSARAVLSHLVEFAHAAASASAASSAIVSPHSRSSSASVSAAIAAAPSIAAIASGKRLHAVMKPSVPARRASGSSLGPGLADGAPTAAASASAAAAAASPPWIWRPLPRRASWMALGRGPADEPAASAPPDAMAPDDLALSSGATPTAGAANSKIAASTSSMATVLNGHGASRYASTGGLGGYAASHGASLDSKLPDPLVLNGVRRDRAAMEDPEDPATAILASPLSARFDPSHPAYAVLMASHAH
ncbi:hypothetical protein CXG81DRAFT_20170 [Caulochytrium protostelioides]|uniref:DH domain-containing protein n=1 Tax=Caulochytrium protostelioides TaxID=1555241 RepID=A0A4P9X424_9FUNG|nr:hypothetical protein CXG81DRAFT_20170 [Caulochytrium protostelioides]|eukprot:RKO99792.1 hypothetical protein CXG81DRAFT_20170 [Caulochytrium protostelioides]